MGKTIGNLQAKLLEVGTVSDGLMLVQEGGGEKPGPVRMEPWLAVGGGGLSEWRSEVYDLDCYLTFN
ncbi:hypothetical protein ACFX15_027053 [Malus domestica]